MYSPERVSTLTLSPMSTKSGTLIVAPVSSVAGLVPPPEAVSPRRPGLGLGHLEDDRGRQLQVAGLAVDEEHVDRRRWAWSSAAPRRPPAPGTAICS